jgi:acyl-CoA dehydrogenase
MEFSDNPDLLAIAEAVEAVCRPFDDEYWAAADRDRRFPVEFFDAMASGGWIGIAMPTELGGGGAGISEAAVVLNRVSASGAAMNGASTIHTAMFGLNPVVRFGNDRLKTSFIPRAAAGELHAAFGVTEPDAGSDSSRIKTRAVEQGDGDWVVTGRKIWMTKALESEVALVLVRTDDVPNDRFRGLSLFLVDLDRRYCDIAAIPKMGRNAIASCEVAFDELPVPAWRLVGERGRGFQHLLHGLNPERVLIAAEACGIGEAALRKAVQYAKDRVVFDRPIGSNQAIAHPLAAAHMKLHAAMLCTMEAAWLYDNDLECGSQATSAKFLAAEAGFFAADRAIQTHGGLGYAEEYHVARYWRESRLHLLAPVSQEMACNFVAHNTLGLPRSY